MMITLLKTHLAEIQAHGQEAFPEECCGAMLGDIDFKTNVKTVKKLIRIENQASENRHRWFEITPQDYQWLESTAKSAGLTLLGFYHTHPNHPAQPSQSDLLYAWPVFSYIIHSVQDGVPSELNSFELDVNTHQFNLELITTL